MTTKTVSTLNFSLIPLFLLCQAANASSVSLGVAPNPSTFGHSVTLTATVTPPVRHGQSDLLRRTADCRRGSGIGGSCVPGDKATCRGPADRKGSIRWRRQQPYRFVWRADGDRYRDARAQFRESGTVHDRRQSVLCSHGGLQRRRHFRRRGPIGNLAVVVPPARERGWHLSAARRSPGGSAADRVRGRRFQRRWKAGSGRGERGGGPNSASP